MDFGTLFHRTRAASASSNPSKSYACWVCGAVYESPVDFLAHLKEAHSELQQTANINR